MRTRRALATLAFLFCAVEAFARAGGGGGFHGGGFSGGGGYSGGGGGGGGGQLLGLYFYFVMLHPLVGLPLTVILIWLLMKNRGSQASSGAAAPDDDAIPRGLDVELQTRRGEALAVIRSRDPGFDEAAFLRRASGAFLAIQDAWSRQDLSKARVFISDGVFERFGRQIADYAARGIRNRMGDVKVLGAEALGYTAGRRYDAVYVRFRASALDEIVTLKDETRLSGGPSEFAEVWTFLRRPGAKTLAHPGAIEGHCPSCGAPLTIVDSAQCSSCKAWLNSGEHDWVLVEITQVSEWAFPDPDREVTGYAAIRDADPGLSLEELEDRASVVFWRWLDARRRADAAPLRGVSTDDFLKKLSFGTEFEQDAAVGLVETVAFQPGADFDRAHVQVRWEAGIMSRAEPREFAAARRRSTHYLILRRKSGAVSDPKAGLRTARCPSCGAPPDEPDAAKCAYCGHAFNDGSLAWILEDLVPFGMWRRPDATDDAPAADAGLDWGDDLPPAEAVAVLAAGLTADGSVDARERAFLFAYANKRGLDPERVEQLVQAALQKRLDVPAPKSGAEAEEMLRGLIRISLADGSVSQAERDLLSAFGRRLGLHEREIGQMIKEERLSLQTRAGAALQSAPAKPGS
ncbi:MAG: TIM44-like domain-containing protein [Elusimicrobia bacterium]|nr:TIM44-like domain-containing protein [Elusimicrobiota bacterium]